MCGHFLLVCILTICATNIHKCWFTIEGIHKVYLSILRPASVSAGARQKLFISFGVFLVNATWMFICRDPGMLLCTSVLTHCQVHGIPAVLIASYRRSGGTMTSVDAASFSPFVTLGLHGHHIRCMLRDSPLFCWDASHCPQTSAAQMSCI